MYDEHSLGVLHCLARPLKFYTLETLSASRHWRSQPKNWGETFGGPNCVILGE